MSSEIQITNQDLLLIIGDQTVTIAALRQQLNTIKANTTELSYNPPQAGPRRTFAEAKNEGG